MARRRDFLQKVAELGALGINARANRLREGKPVSLGVLSPLALSVPAVNATWKMWEGLTDFVHRARAKTNQPPVSEPAENVRIAQILLADRGHSTAMHVNAEVLGEAFGYHRGDVSHVHWRLPASHRRYGHLTILIAEDGVLAFYDFVPWLVTFRKGVELLARHNRFPTMGTLCRLLGVSDYNKILASAFYSAHEDWLADPTRSYRGAVRRVLEKEVYGRGIHSRRSRWEIRTVSYYVAGQEDEEAATERLFGADPSSTAPYVAVINNVLIDQLADHLTPAERNGWYALWEADKTGRPLSRTEQSQWERAARHLRRELPPEDITLES